MINAPKTLEEARARRYGEWAGYPVGRRYDPMRCAYEVYPQGGHGWVPWQCARKPGFGPDKLYCRQHAAKLT